MEIPFKKYKNFDFEKYFSTEEKCLEFLAEQKWPSEYSCKKCGHTNFCPGKTPYSRRCTKCKHDESPKVGTLFEGCRFPLPKAFYIAFVVCNAQQTSSVELAKKLDLRHMTCWAFKKRLHECVKSNTELDENQKIEIEKIILSSKPLAANNLNQSKCQ